MTVALIDDDEAVLDSLKMLLHSRGIVVECFTSASDFLVRLEAMSLSCIVSDVRMPGLSGWDLQKELVKRRNSVPLILITGDGDIAMAVSAVELGAFDVIEKPLDHCNLMESIRRATEGAELPYIRQE
jgi:two-component system, LuxR family, response regulator FixJ